MFKERTMFKRKKSVQFTQFEYLIFERQVTQKELNDLGEDGWELISTHSVVIGKNGRIYQYALKRRK